MVKAYLYAFSRFYNSSFQRAPGLTLALTNGALSGVADVVAQTTQIFFLDEPSADGLTPYYPSRTLRFIAFGVGMGPIIGKWNNVLEKNFPLRSVAKSLTPSGPPRSPIGRPPAPATAGAQPKVSLAALGKRVLADQAFMAPVGLVLFIASMGIMEGRTTRELKEKYQDMFVPAILANWTVWPFIQLVNFRYMPLAYRVPFQSSCGVLWTLYLSILNSNKGGAKAE